MKLTPDQKAGIYITVSVHLAVIIILLLVQIGFVIQKENSFVLDFTKQEEIEAQKEKEELIRSASELLDQMIAASAEAVPIRNVTVDRSALKDDRGTNAEELYKEAERLAQELKDGQSRPQEVEEIAVEPVRKEEQPKQEEATPYSGPSVLSWSLDGRKASKLPIPAYRCYGAGEVTVIITVDNSGKVINAKVDDKISTADNCLRSYAVYAARKSLFSSSAEAPARQMGTITYAFIAQ